MKKLVTALLGILLFLITVVSGAYAESMLQFGMSQRPYLPLKKEKATVYAFVDDYVTEAKIKLPFPFRLGTRWYDEVNVHENGFVWFGSKDLNGQNVTNPLIEFQKKNVEAIISVFGTDLCASTRHKSVILSQITGEAPQRVLTVEWNTLSRADKWFDGEVEQISFQLRLHEKNGEIEFQYGDFQLADGAESTALVGLLMNTGSKQDFLTNPSEGSWANGINIQAQSNLFPVSPSAKPTKGLCYRFYTSIPYALLENEDGFIERIEIEELPSAYDQNHVETNDHKFKSMNISERYLAKHQLGLPEVKTIGDKNASGNGQNLLSQLVSSVRWRTN